MICIENKQIPSAPRSGCLYSIDSAISINNAGGSSGGSIDTSGLVALQAITGTSHYVPMYNSVSDPFTETILYQSGTTITSGKIGVGTNHPYYRLHVLGSGATASALHCYFPSAQQQSNAVVMQGANSAYFVAHSENVETVFGASVLGVGVAGTLDSCPMELRTANAKRICLTNTCTYITTPATICTSVVSPVVCASSCVKSPVLTGSTCVVTPTVKTDILTSKTVPFISDPLTGQGFCIGSTGDAEVQNLRVICGLYAREFVIDKTKAIPDVVISPGGMVCALSGLTYDSTLGKYYFTVPDEHKYNIQHDDGLWSQQVNGNGTHSCFLRAFSGNSSTCRVYVCENYNCTCQYFGQNLANVSYCCFNLTEPPGFYGACSTAVGNYGRTGLLCFRAGSVLMNQYIGVNLGCVSVQMYDSSSNLICDLGYKSGCVCNQSITITANCRYCFRYVAGTSSSNLMFYRPTFLNTYLSNVPDVRDWTFAQWGNKTNAVRQNLIHMSSIGDRPYIRMLTNVTGQTITQANIKTCLDSQALCTWGAYLVDANVSGTVCAGSGCIGGWNINNNGIEDDFINLNSETHTISVGDVNGVERIIIHNGNPTSVANLLCGSCVNITTANCLAPANITIQGCSGNLSCLTYYEQQTAGSNLAADNYASLCTTKRFTLCSGNSYTNRIIIQAVDCYQLPTNTCVGDSCNWTCTEYSKCGTYTICSNTCLLDNNNILLRQQACSVNLTPTNSGDYTTIGGLSLQNTLITGNSVYFVTNYCRINNVYTQRKASVYLNCNLYRVDCFSENLNLCNTICINRINLVSVVGKTEITPTSIQGIYCNNNGYRYDATANNFCFFSPVTACNVSVANTLTTCGMVYSQKCVTSTPITIANCDAYINWNVGSAGCLCMPPTPVTGQMHILTNKTTAYNVTINGNGKCIYDNASTVSCVNIGNRHSVGIMYNGTAWSILFYR